jgi:ssDNA-binding Zn-finger/Zn-ribbon topoisomerase 1
MILMIRKAKRPQQVCINPDCPAKVIPFTPGEKCPKCPEGELVLRKSVYGHFAACNKFPKCHYIVKRKKDDGSVVAPLKSAKKGKETAPAAETAVHAAKTAPRTPDKDVVMTVPAPEAEKKHKRAAKPRAKKAKEPQA